MRRTMTSILTAIGLGGSSAETIATLLEHERIALPEREVQFSTPLNLMMARTIQPGKTSLVYRKTFN
jgi:hypothetical protein